MSTVEDRLASQLDDVLAGAVARRVAPGFVAVVTDHEATIYNGVAGRLAIDTDTEATVGTLFRLASMTKPLTTVAALQLIENGRLGLEDEVISILPAFGELQVLTGFDADGPVLRPPAAAATILHLLTHTSGHGYWWGNAGLAQYREALGMDDILSGRLAALNAPSVADPGTRWEYGISTDWLGRVIEAVTGMRLGDYLTERVLGPLRMLNTTFSPTLEARAELMAVHDRTANGDLKRSTFDWADVPEFDAGGHGLYSTGPDYARFMRAMLRDGELDGARVLRKDTVELAFSDQLGGRPLPEYVPTQAPWLLNDVVALPFRQSWGFGFQLMLEDIPGMRRAGTGFWSGIVNTYFWIDRRSGLAAAVMTQLLPLFDAAVLETLAAFESAVYAAV